MEDSRTEVVLVRIDELRQCIQAVFERLGVAAEEAGGLADLLVDSELRGHPDHGVAAIELLARFYREGRSNPRPRVRVLSESDGALLLDGDGGCGPGAPTQAMEWCIEHARARRGMAAAAIRNWQMVVGGPYVRLAAEAGLIGFACTNYIPYVAPPGGRTAVLGTNPMAYGIPAGRHPHVVLDMATSVGAVQKVRVAARRGEPVPAGLILDDLGRTITDPQEFLQGGLMAPLGFPLAPHKGFGLALLVDVLSGVLSGAGFAGTTVAGATGNFLWALDVEAFMPVQEFLDRVDSQLDQIQGGERLPGIDELAMPGERGERRRRSLTERGVVPVAAAGWRVLAEAGDSLGVALPPVVEE